MINLMIAEKNPKHVALPKITYVNKNTLAITI